MSSHARRNIGIFAHVDAGKTTTTEYMLYTCGKIRSVGHVDAGTSQTDWLDVERERGISVRAASASLEWKGVQINLIDTPGHVDFLSEVERPLRVMDGAVLIVSAAEGVQAQTEVIWHALRTLNIPTVIYVNKMDRTGADPVKVLAEIRRLLSPAAIPVQMPEGREAAFSGTSPIRVPEANAGAGYDPSPEFTLEGFTQCLAETDDDLLERYLADESIPVDELYARLAVGARQGTLFPVLFGCSAQGLGVPALLDALIDYLPEPRGDADKPVSGVVFKIERNKSMGRIAYVRLYNGTIRNRDSVRNVTRRTQEKVTQIRRVEGQRHEDIGILTAGDIAAVCGFSEAQIGDILGSPEGVPPEHRMAVPLLTVKVEWKREADYPKLVAALQELTEEDPLLGLKWHTLERELHVSVMGKIQLEILSATLKNRFGLEADFGQPSVIYKETPSRAGEGFYAYTMPKPCWAILRFRIEPGERGSGLVYRSEVRAERLLPAYQNEVERRIPAALQQGLLGWEVTDLAITLVDGEHHVWHTHPLDFVVATPMALMEGLAQTGTTLLEPLLDFRITVPGEFGGKVLSDLVLMRADFDPPTVTEERFTVEGRVPVATSLEYPVTLASLSGGRGSMVTGFAGYRECPPGTGISRDRVGVNPLDHAKYILSVRNALSQEV